MSRQIEQSSNIPQKTKEKLKTFHNFRKKLIGIQNRQFSLFPFRKPSFEGPPPLSAPHVYDDGGLMEEILLCSRLLGPQVVLD